MTNIYMPLISKINLKSRNGLGIVFFIWVFISMPSCLNGTVLFSHSSEEICFDHPLYPIAQAREEGFWKVSEIHTLFYAVYGNPNGIPVVVLHGGPGAGCSDNPYFYTYLYLCIPENEYK